MIREESGYWKQGAFYPYIKGEYYLEHPTVIVNGEVLNTCVNISFRYRSTPEEAELLDRICGVKE